MKLRAIAGVHCNLKIWWHWGFLLGLLLELFGLRAFAVITYRFDYTEGVRWDYLQIWWRWGRLLGCSFSCCRSGTGSSSREAESAITRRTGSTSALSSGSTAARGAMDCSQTPCCSVESKSITEIVGGELLKQVLLNGWQLKHGSPVTLIQYSSLKRGVANLTVILQHRQGIVEYLSIKDLVSCAFCKDEDA